MKKAQVSRVSVYDVISGLAEWQKSRWRHSAWYVFATEEGYTPGPSCRRACCSLEFWRHEIRSETNNLLHSERNCPKGLAKTRAWGVHSVSLEKSFGEYCDIGSKCETMHHGQARFWFNAIIQSIDTQRYANQTWLRGDNLASLGLLTRLHLQNRRASRATTKMMSRAWFMKTVLLWPRIYSNIIQP